MSTSRILNIIQVILLLIQVAIVIYMFIDIKKSQKHREELDKKFYKDINEQKNKFEKEYYKLLDIQKKLAEKESTFTLELLNAAKRKIEGKEDWQE